MITWIGEDREPNLSGEYEAILRELYPEDFVESLIANDETVSVFLGGPIRHEKHGDLLIRYVDGPDKVGVMGLLSKSGRVKPSDASALKSWLKRLRDALDSGKEVFVSLNDRSEPLFMRALRGGNFDIQTLSHHEFPFGVWRTVRVTSNPEQPLEVSEMFHGEQHAAQAVVDEGFKQSLLAAALAVSTLFGSLTANASFKDVEKAIEKAKVWSKDTNALLIKGNYKGKMTKVELKKGPASGGFHIQLGPYHFRGNYYGVKGSNDFEWVGAVDRDATEEEKAFWYDSMKLMAGQMDKINSLLREDQELFTDPTSRYWGNAGAGGIFYAKDTGRYLIAKRSPDVNEPNQWGTWGGKLDGDETPEEALEREVREETGYSGEYDLKWLYTFEDKGFRFDNYLIIVPSEFDPKHSWETSDHRWVKAGEWPRPIHFGLKSLIPHLTKG